MDGKVLALMSAFCFGVNPIVLSLGLNKANSDVAVFVGLLSGLPVLLFVSPVAGGLEFGQLTWLATFYFVLGGLFGVFLGRAFLYTSIKKLGSSRASTFKNAGPVVTSLMALIFLNELVGVGRWMGIAMVTAGLMMVGQMARRAENPMTLSGLAIASMSALSYGIRPIFTKLGFNIVSVAWAATFISYVTALVLYLAYFLLRGRLAASVRTDRRSMLYFAIGGLLQSIGLLLQNYALQGDDVTIIYPISASAPLVTFLLSYTVLKNIERLTFWDFVGTVLVIAGVSVLLI